MAAPAALTHMFAELYLLEDLGTPLKGSSRIRFTCMSVSRRYIALGCNTGGVYIFGRDSLKHLQSIYGDVDACPVSAVALGPNELSVGFAVSSGQVVVMEMNIERRSKPERLRQTTDHVGSLVTAMVWDSASSSLFVGDSAGKVTHINVPTSKAKTIFSQPSQTIVHLDCGVTQLDWWGNKLLASSLTGTYLLNTTKQQFSQIGKKPREGEFGACFYLEPSSKYPVIYCARPGSRMWEVDFEGNVLNTHQFKQLLDTQPLPIIAPGMDLVGALKAPVPGPQSVNFIQMFTFGEFILSWSNRGLYVFDPISVKVVLWTDALRGIKDVSIIKNEIYIFLDSQKIRRLVFLPILHLCAALITRQRCLMAADVLLFLEHFAVKPSLLKHVKKELLPQLLALLREMGRDDVGDKVQAMLEDVSESSMDSVIFQDDGTDGGFYPAYTTQNSGIVVVSDGSLSFGDLERRKSPSRFSPVSLSLQHTGSNRASPLSDPENKEQHSANGPAKRSEWTAAVTAEHPQAVSGALDAATYTADSSVYASVQEVTCGTTQYTELPTNDAMERSRGYSADSDRSGVCALDGREEADSPVSTLSEQTPEPDRETRLSVLSEEHVTENGQKVSDLNSVGDDSHCDTSVSVRENHHEENAVKRDHADGEADDNQKGVLVRDQTTGKRDDTHNTAMVEPPGVKGLMRKVNSMPEIVQEDGEKREGSVVKEDGVSRKSSVQSAVRRASSGYPAGSIAKTVKKKKRRRVNEVNIAMAGGSSGQMNRTLSMDSLKQKQKKEVGQPTRSLTSSPTGPQEPLHRTASADMDTISITTVDSIEEEAGTVSNGTAGSPRSALEDDVFAAPASTKAVSSGREVLGTDSTSLGEVMDITRGSLATGHGADLSDSDSETVLPHTSFPGGVTARVGSHEDAEIAGRNLELAVNDSYHERRSLPSLDSPRDGKTLTDASRSLSVEKLAFRVSDLESEVIPPLIERLSALGVAPASLRSEEGVGNVHDLSSMKSLFTEASKQKIASVRERVTKFGSSTKSLIRRVKEKNPLMSKSPYGSPPLGSRSLSTSPTFKEEDSSSGGREMYADDTALPPVAPDLPASCPVTLDPLLAQTELTQEQLRDHSVLLDQHNLRAVLNTWAAELNRTLVAYHQELRRQQAAQQHTGKTADHGKHAQVSNGTEKLNNSVKEIRGAEMLHLEMEQTGGRGGMNGGDTGQNTGEISSRHADFKQADDGVRDDVCQDASDTPFQRRNPLDECGTRNHFGGGGLASDHCDAEGSVPPHSDALHSARCTEEDGPRAASEQPSDEQSVCDQTSSTSATFPAGPEEEASGNPIRTKASAEKEVISSVKTSHAEERLGDPEEELPIDWTQVRHVKDPFKLSPQQHTAISTLVSYCLNCQCFGNVSKFFSLPTPESDVSSDKEQTSKSFPLSFQNVTTHTGTGTSCAAEKCLHQVTSQEPSLLHDHQTSATSVDAPPFRDPHQCSTTVVAEHNSGALEGCQTVDDPTVQYSLLREDAMSKKLCQHSEDGSHVLKDVGSRDTEDEARGLFVQLYYHFIPFWRLRQLLAESDVSRVHATWCALVTCCQELGHGDTVWTKIQDRDITGALDYLRSGILPNKQAFLGHVASLFELNALRVTDFLSEIPRQVKLGDILHLCHLHSKPAQQVVSRYLALRLGATPYTGRLEILKQMCLSTETKLAVLECLLNLQSSSQSSSTAPVSGTDMQSRASADLSRFSPDMVSETLECVLSSMEGEECCRALETCRQRSYWPGCLKLLKQTNQWQKALQLEVKLNDINLLNGRLSYGYIPRDAEQWQYLLHLYQQESASQRIHPEPSHPADVSPPSPPPPTPASPLPSSTPTQTSAVPPPPPPSSSSPQQTSGNEAQESDANKHCSSRGVAPDIEATALSWLQSASVERTGTAGCELSWLSLGLLAAHHLGSSSAVQLLQSCVESQDTSAAGTPLTADFYRTCLALSALHNQQKLVIHNMLEKVDSYLWAKKPVHLTPQVHYAAAQEKSAVQNGNTDDHNYHNLFARLSSASVADHQLAEDPDCHWGVHTNILQVCEACGIEVSETVSLLEPGVFIFKCGHVFHKFCIPEKECPLC